MGHGACSGSGSPCIPNWGSHVKTYYTAVVALKGTEAAIGIKKAETEQEVLNARGDFPSAKAKGVFFQGRSRGWGAVDGYTQVIVKSQEATAPGSR